MTLFSIGTSEMIIVGLLALVVLGPKRLPDMARMLGQGMRELLKAKEDLTDAIKKDPDLAELKKVRSAFHDSLTDKESDPPPS